MLRYRLFATAPGISGFETVAGVRMDNTALLVDTADVYAARALVDPHATCEAGKAGSCEFTILPSHALYNQLTRLTTYITFEEIDEDIRHDVVLLRGRIVEMETDLFGQKKVTCEGALAYLGDSVKSPVADKTASMAVTDYFTQAITEHNGQVEAAKQFTVGRITDYNGVNDTFNESNYQNTSRALEEMIDYHGGYLKLRYSGATTYIDYVKDTATSGRKVPRIAFAKNLVDFSEKVSAEDIFTVLIPIGDKTETGEGTKANSIPLTLTPKELTVDSVISGANAIAKYGRIVRAESFSGVKDAATLLQRAQDYIRANYNTIPEEFTVKAIDLRYLDEGDVPLASGENVQLEVAVTDVHAVNRTLRCLSIQYDLFNPENNEIRIGTDKQEIKHRSLTSQQASNASKSKSASRTAKANAEAVEYLTWKDIQEATKLDLAVTDVNLINSGLQKTVRTDGKIVFKWIDDTNTGVSSAKTTAADANTKATDNETEISHHSVALWGTGRTYDDWQRFVAQSGSHTLIEVLGDIYAENGIFKRVVVEEGTTSRSIAAEYVTVGDNIVTRKLVVRRDLSSDSSDIVQLGGTLQADNSYNTRPYLTVTGTGTTYVKDLKQFDSANNPQSIVTYPEYPLLSIATIDNKKYLVSGNTTKGEAGYSPDVQKVALSDLLDGANLTDYAQLDQDVTFGVVTGSGFKIQIGTGQQGQALTANFNKAYQLQMGTAVVAGGNYPHLLGTTLSGYTGPIDLGHTHEFTAVSEKDSSNNETGKVKIVLKNAIPMPPGQNENAQTFDIASTKFFKDAIAGAKQDASVNGITYDGATGGMTVGYDANKRVNVLNNVPLLLTLYGKENDEPITQNRTVSGVELPSVSFQNGSGAAPSITYQNGAPVIDVKAVMGGTTIKAAESFTGNAVTLNSSYSAPSKSSSTANFTARAYNGTSLTSENLITSKAFTLEHAIGQTTSGGDKYLRVRTNEQITGSETSSPIFYTDYKITWNSDSILNSGGDSSVTAKVFINGVQYDSHTFTGVYDTVASIANGGNAYLDGTNLKVPAKALDANSVILKTDNVQVGTVSVTGGGTISQKGDSKTVSVKVGGVEIGSATVDADYADKAAGWAAAYEKVSLPVSQPSTWSSEITIETPKSKENTTPDRTKYTLVQDSWTDNKKYVYLKTGDNQVARTQIDASQLVSNAETAAKNAVTIGDPTVTYGSTKTSFKLKTSAPTPYEKTFDWFTTVDSTPVSNTSSATGQITINANGGTAANPTVRVASGSASVELVGDGLTFTEANIDKPLIFKVQSGSTVIAQKTVNVKYTGNSSQYDSMNVDSVAFSNIRIAKDTSQGTSADIYQILADQKITLGDGGEDTTHGFSTPWVTTATPSVLTSGQLHLNFSEGPSSGSLSTAGSADIPIRVAYARPSDTTKLQIQAYHTSIATGNLVAFSNLSVSNSVTPKTGTTAELSVTPSTTIAALSYPGSDTAIGYDRVWASGSGSSFTIYGAVTENAEGSDSMGSTYAYTTKSYGLYPSAIDSDDASLYIRVKDSASSASYIAQSKVTLASDSLTIDPGEAAVVYAKVGNDSYASLAITANPGSMDLTQASLGFAQGNRTTISSENGYYATMLKAVLSDEDGTELKSESTPITASYAIHPNSSDYKLYLDAIARVGGVEYARNGDWVANLNVERTEPESDSDTHQFYISANVATNGRASGASVGTLLASRKIGFNIRGNNAILSPGEERDISVSLVADLNGTDSTYATSTVHVRCTGSSDGSGGGAADILAGWTQAVGKVSVPTSMSSSDNSSFTIGYPTEEYDTSSSTKFKLVQEGSNAFVRHATNDYAIAKLPLDIEGGSSSSGSEVDGWVAARERVSIPTNAGSFGFVTLSVPSGSYPDNPSDMTTGRRSVVYTLTQSGNYAYISTGTPQVNVAVKQLDMSSGWNAARTLATYPSTANAGSSTFSIGHPKEATSTNNEPGADTITYKLVQVNSNVYVQSQQTMQYVAGLPVVLPNVTVEAKNVGLLAADGKTHEIKPSSGYTYMSSVTYTAPSVPTQRLVKKIQLSTRPNPFASGYLGAQIVITFSDGNKQSATVSSPTITSNYTFDIGY